MLEKANISQNLTEDIEDILFSYRDNYQASELDPRVTIEISSPRDLQVQLQEIRTPSQQFPRLTAFLVSFRYIYDNKVYPWKFYVEAERSSLSKKLNYVVYFFNNDGKLSRKREKYSSILDQLRNEGKQSDIQQFALTVLRLMRFSKEDLAYDKSKNKVTENILISGLKVFSIIAISESLRDVLALPISFINFYDLYHKPKGERVCFFNQLFDQDDPILPFVSKGGAEILRRYSITLIAQEFHRVFDSNVQHGIEMIKSIMGDKEGVMINISQNKTAQEAINKKLISNGEEENQKSEISQEKTTQEDKSEKKESSHGGEKEEKENMESHEITTNIDEDKYKFSLDKKEEVKNGSSHEEDFSENRGSSHQNEAKDKSESSSDDDNSEKKESSDDEKEEEQSESSDDEKEEEQSESSDDEKEEEQSESSDDENDVQTDVKCPDYEEAKKIIRKMGSQTHVANLLRPYVSGLDISQPHISFFLNGRRPQINDRIIQGLYKFLKEQ